MMYLFLPMFVVRLVKLFPCLPCCWLIPQSHTLSCRYGDKQRHGWREYQQEMSSTSEVHFRHLKLLSLTEYICRNQTQNLA